MGSRIADRSVASVDCGWTSDWSEHARSGGRVASIVGAWVSVIADNGWFPDASMLWVAHDCGALVCLLCASYSSVDAVSRGQIARVGGTDISVVAGLVCCDTSNLWITSNAEAIE